MSVFNPGSVLEDREISKVLNSLAGRVVNVENNDLVTKAARGDERAFGILLEKYRDKVYRVLYFMVHNQEEALDLLQDTFLKAYKSLHKLRSPGAFYSWLIKIAMNLALNELKKKKRFRENQEVFIEQYTSKAESPIEILERKELQEKISSLISSLPDKQKAALILCDVEGYSYKEIAQILKCRLGTVMSRIYYAREYIRKNLLESKPHESVL